MNQPENIEESLYTLLSKYILKEANAAEKAVVEQWLQRDATNKETFHKLEAIINNPIPSNLPVLNVNAAWKAIETAIAYKHKDTKVVQMNRRRVWAIAAAAVLVAVVGIWYLRSSNTGNTPVVFNTPGNHQLPDGSMIRLKENSSISTSENFGRKNRTVSFQGEAFFDIKRDTALPFIVDMPSGTVRVLGTSFTVLYRETDSLFKLYVTTGKVQVQEKNTGKGVVLTPGQLFDWKAKQKTFLVSDNISDWDGKKFSLNGKTFVGAIHMIESVYGVTIRFEKEKYSEIVIEGAVFDNQSVEKVLETICFLANTSFSKTAEGSFVIK
jgi:transmembrane sensor